MTADDRALLRGRLAVADQYLTGLPDAPPLPGILGLLGHHPRLASNWLAMNGELLDDPNLEPRDRELLILRVAWRTQCRYEWAQHSRMAEAAGLSAGDVAAVAGPIDAERWSARDRHLLTAADEMIADHRVGDETWQGLADQFDERQLLELLFIVGAYSCLAFVLNSTELLPEPGTDDGRASLPGPEST